MVVNARLSASRDQPKAQWRSSCRPTASSYAARRLGRDTLILYEGGGLSATVFPAASRVSISELLGC